ncbi:histone-lysine N-methyltransferase set-1-like [Clavelina lepadiformis]|uniref:[histone H4]-lysine(20) N-methyltransferase n=1 Tax=Clavelina lepadiformis TaxID=159417 RepID=A0ABP0F2V1_CLALP
MMDGLSILSKKPAVEQNKCKRSCQRKPKRTTNKVKHRRKVEACHSKTVEQNTIEKYSSPSKNFGINASLKLPLSAGSPKAHNGYKIASAMENPDEVSKTSNCVEAKPSVESVGFMKMSPYGEPNKAGEALEHKPRLNVNPIKMENLSTIKTKTSKRKTSSMSKTTQGTKAKSIENRKLTEYFPTRKSSRKPKSVIKKEQENDLIDAVLSHREDSLKVVEFTSKGRGVIANRNISHGEFVVEYAGDLITWPEAKDRELEYALDSSIGCYMYYFTSRGQNYCIDATAESGRLGRLLNHSRKNPNCHTRLVWIPDGIGEQRPHLVIMAKRDIDKDEELLYDYGDRDRAALQVHPWLKT